MSDIGKAIYLACSALLFIFATTAAIYLYTTLDQHMDLATELSKVFNRAEGESYIPAANERVITWAEIKITADNMLQMHVDKIVIKNKQGDTLKEIEYSEDEIEKLSDDLNVNAVLLKDCQYTRYDSVYNSNSEQVKKRMVTFTIK